MSANKSKIGSNILTATLITLLAFGLSLLFSQPLAFSAGALLQSADKQDFNMTDFYNIAADARPVMALDTNIVVVDIANTTRDDVTDVLELLGDMNPRAVGIDITFNEQREDDERLLEAIDRCPNPVLAVGVSAKPTERDTFMVDDFSYFYPFSRDSRTYGVINLPTKFDGATVRNFRVDYTEAGGRELPSFALAVARVADPQAAKRVEARGNTVETIDFPSRRFTVIPWTELPDRPDEIDGKIVLVGAIGELGDVHRTPVNDKMAGVIIHAHALSTILRDSFYTVAPKFVNILLAFLICFSLCFTNLQFKSPARGLWFRIYQIAMLYLMIRLGYWLFVDNRTIVDFSYSMLMLAFGFFAFDLWSGLTHYIKLAYNRIFFNQSHK